MNSRIAFAGQHQSPDASCIFHLAGPVEALEQREWPLLAFWRRTRLLTRFKPDGNRVDHTVFGADGQIVSRYIYGYDAEGHRTGPTFHLGPQLVLDHRVVFEYGPDGRRLSQEQHRPDGRLEFRVHFAYDAEGRRVGMRWVGPDGAVLRSYSFGYDRRGRVSALECTGPDGRRQWRLRHLYTGGNTPLLVAGQRALRFLVTFGKGPQDNWTRGLRLVLGYWPRLRVIPVPYCRVSLVSRRIQMRAPSAPDQVPQPMETGASA